MLKKVAFSNDVVDFKKVVAFPNGEVNLYYTDKVVTYPKNGEPIIRFKIYYIKDLNGFMGNTEDLYNYSD